MVLKRLNIVFITLVVFLSLVTRCNANEAYEEKHAQVAMRMIGHNFLLSIEDSVSRILPIEKEGLSYRISFETKFGFFPESLVSTITNVLKETQIATKYVVEVEDLNSDLVVYSYEVGVIDDFGEVNCVSRELPEGSYSFLITLLDTNELLSSQEDISALIASNEHSSEDKGTIYPIVALLIVILVILIGMFAYFRKMRSESAYDSDPNMISIGEYLFDKRNMKLSFDCETIELTSKESDLLLLMHSSANETVERENILKEVWGDEGDYIGRTLDVFISKLRKKLESDPSIKIINIRGVGYKLVLNHS